jgi:hypothetical protein
MNSVNWLLKFWWSEVEGKWDEWVPVGNLEREVEVLEAFLYGRGYKSRKKKMKSDQCSVFLYSLRGHPPVLSTLCMVATRLARRLFTADPYHISEAESRGFDK